MPSKAAGVALAAAGTYAAAQAFITPGPVNQNQQVRHLRQATQQTSAASSCASGALAVGVAGVAVATATQKRANRRCQVKGC